MVAACVTLFVISVNCFQMIRMLTQVEQKKVQENQVISLYSFQKKGIVSESLVLEIKLGELISYTWMHLYN